ncbi:cyclic nucleotide-binding protein [Flavobacterium rivuli WB 3.3-2 = DSM 21788]|uniref:Cyclic nucleotide-binding protein n=1 Tax=Flavobacterium rivuli WB 3.3-2 = DSM 21788 TaxID=1121895 RepID=A0A0A2M235_9FLAO|nr:Crp/Fnr family transcriptional regulator [Flavobacterium rivuli]KGO86662.1 cyclic nucleotide-binding protein [Flavobacterium rivuli WB 3.3-2 = DSM 21788]
MYEVFQNYLNNKISLTDEEADLIKSVTIIKKLRKKQYLLQQGDVWGYNAFITQGCLRTYSVDEKGMEHVLSFAVENWWIGDRESLLSGEPSRFNIDAIEDSEVAIIRKVDFDRLCREIPAFNDMVNLILQKSFVASQNRIHSAISFTAEEKYLNFIQKYAGFALRIPQNMIASYLGITPETLSRIRNQSAKK